MERLSILRSVEHPEWKGHAGARFHQALGVPQKTQPESMDACLSGQSSGAQWYDTLYLLVDHDSVYKRCSRMLFCAAPGDGETELSSMHTPTYLS